MVEAVQGLQHHISLALSQLLAGDEVIAIVDDDPSIREPLKEYFLGHGLAIVECGTGQDLMNILSHRKVALVLLDIGLPDADGLSLLPQIVDQYPDVAVVMLTGVADLQVALDCIRKGASDYLSKPVQFEEIFHIAKKALEKRRLVFENRKYQEELEEAHFRIKLLHQLSIKMNTVYLSTVELDEILRAILVGITANEGLGFNRAFLAMFNEDRDMLEGKMAIGPSCREEAARIWTEMRQRELNFLQIVQNIKDKCADQDVAVNRIVSSLRIPVSDSNNILIKSTSEKRSIKVSRENGSVPVPLERRRHRNGRQVEEQPFPHDRRRPPEEIEQVALPVPHDLINLLGEDTFVVVPLYSPGRAFGVLIADNYVTRRPILDSHVSALELFASQASLAIEHSHLYLDMQKKIAELEALNHELDKNKDLLVAAERYSALGQMAAQLVHTIRNPVTSIGGVSRILAKKITDDEWIKYLEVIIKETKRLESTLGDLFDFVTQSELEKATTPLYTVIKKTLLLVQKVIDVQKVEVELDLPEPEPSPAIDIRQVQQMLLHLLRNALDAMVEGGKLTIAVRTAGDKVYISVMDTGSGITDSHLAKVRDPFFTTKTYGTGMGLTMVERISQAHGGSFQLKRRPAGGMEALVTLPLN